MDRELDVLHFLVVLFEFLPDLVQLSERFGHVGRQRFFDPLRSADPCDHVFALSVDEVVAAEAGRTEGTVARQADARRTVIAQIAEDHRLHVGGRAPFVRDAVRPAIDHRAVVHPAPEHSADRAPNLFHRIGREVFPGASLDEQLELGDQLFESRDGESRILGDSFFLTLVFESHFKRVAFGLVLRLQLEHDIAVHLDEAAIAVPSRTLVAGLLGQRDDGRVVEADVQYGVHHAGHRFAGTRTAREEQRIGRTAELGSHRLLNLFQGVDDLLLQLGRERATVGVVIGADFGRQSETRWHRQPDPNHLGQIGPLATQQGFHCGVAIRFTITKVINVLRRHATSSRTRPRNRGLTHWSPTAERNRSTVEIGHLRRGLSPPISHQNTRRESIDHPTQLQALGDKRPRPVSQNLKSRRETDAVDQGWTCNETLCGNDSAKVALSLRDRRRINKRH